MNNPDEVLRQARGRMRVSTPEENWFKISSEQRRLDPNIAGLRLSGGVSRLLRAAGVELDRYVSTTLNKQEIAAQGWILDEHISLPGRMLEPPKAKILKGLMLSSYGDIWAYQADVTRRTTFKEWREGDWNGANAYMVDPIVFDELDLACDSLYNLSHGSTNLDQIVGSISGQLNLQDLVVNRAVHHSLELTKLGLTTPVVS